MIEQEFKRDPSQMAWVDKGRCVGVDPELFFPVGITDAAAKQAAEAKAVCFRCEVRDECLEWALMTCQDAGVWGGMDEEQRRVIRRARRRAREAARAASFISREGATAEVEAQPTTGELAAVG